MLFEPLDAATASLIKEEIEYVIIKYEPRVSALRIDVDANYERNGFEVAIAFEIVGIETDVAVKRGGFLLRTNSINVLHPSCQFRL